MDTDELTIEEKCENLMQVVVESRKRFGKMSVEYDQKISLMENKILKLRLETITSHRFKSKNLLPDLADVEMSDDSEDFTIEVIEHSSKIENLLKNIKDTQNVIAQVLGDNLVRRTDQPLTSETMVNLAKDKHLQ